MRHVLASWWWVWVVFWLARAAQGQVGPYVAVTMPYGGNQPAWRAMGGVAPALADELPSGSGNPAGVAWIERVAVAVEGQVTRTCLSFRQSNDGQTPDPTFAEWFVPSHFGIAVPLRLWGRALVVSAVYEGPAAIEFDGTHFRAEIKAEKEGAVSSVFVGAAWPLSRRVTLGLGATKWFGEPRWKLSLPVGPLGTESGRVEQDYQGVGMHLAGHMRRSRWSTAGVLHLPHRFLRGVALTGFPKEVEAEYRLSQDFSGALQLGLAYGQNQRWMVCTAVLLQRGATFRTQGDSLRLDEHVSAASRIALGAQYRFVLDNVGIFAYICYAISRLPKAQGTDLLGFFQLDRTDDDLLAHELTLGASVEVGKCTLHVKMQWNQSSFLVRERALAPPGS